MVIDSSLPCSYYLNVKGLSPATVVLLSTKENNFNYTRNNLN